MRQLASQPARHTQLTESHRRAADKNTKRDLAFWCCSRAVPRSRAIAPRYKWWWDIYGSACMPARPSLGVFRSRNLAYIWHAQYASYTNAEPQPTASNAIARLLTDFSCSRTSQAACYDNVQMRGIPRRKNTAKIDPSYSCISYSFQRVGDIRRCWKTRCTKKSCTQTGTTVRLHR